MDKTRNTKASLPTGLRGLCAIERRPQILESAQGLLGRALLLTLALACLVLIDTGLKEAVFLVVAAGACAYLPRFRSVVFAAAAAVLLLRRPFWPAQRALDVAVEQVHLVNPSSTSIAILALATYFGFASATLEFVRRNKTSFFSRRPLLSLLALLTLLCGLSCTNLVQGLARVALWAFLSVFVAYLWHLAYALLDQRSKDRSPHILQLGTLRRFWGGTSVPFGKGAALLRRAAAKTKEELAVTQLKGLKLLVWALILEFFHQKLVQLNVAVLHIPKLSEVQSAHAAVRPYSIGMGWCSLAWDVLQTLFDLTISGHICIGLARLGGYRLLRNTYRPFESRTLVEYWNRYYYYFKELLVDFFFLPTFLRFFRNRPRLRVFFATFMAAGVGNALFHFVRDIHCILGMGLRNALLSYTSYLFYCFALATGIGISQLRLGRKAKTEGTWLRMLGSCLSVWLFVLCLHVFGNETRDFSLRQRLWFMASLWGIN